MWHRAEQIVVGIEIGRRLASRPFQLGFLQARLQRTDDALGNPVLQLENIIERAVEFVGPEMGARRDIDQLAGDADAVAGLAHAAFEDVAHAQFVRDLLNIHRPALVDEARIARDHEQFLEPRQRGNDVLNYAVGEIFLLGIDAQLLKGSTASDGLSGNANAAEVAEAAVTGAAPCGVASPSATP